ncbi:MAG: hypothetical protein IJN82_00060 [Clostridia bacterium]|nr:hypothetical protein [Clostridia bacterium]
MNKRIRSYLSIYAVVAVLFALLFLIIPFPKPGASWVMFAFSLIAVAAGCALTCYAFEKDEPLMSKFYGFPLFRLGTIYIIVQLLLSVIVFAVGGFIELPLWVGFLLSLPPAGFAAVGAIAADRAREYRKEIDTQTVAQTRTVSLFKTNILEIVLLNKNEAVQAPLKKLETKFKYTDPVSRPETEEKEQEIHAALADLKGMIRTAETEAVLEQIETVDRLLTIRNQIKGML